MKSFNDLLQQYYDLKKQHSPYDYREWRVGGDAANSCKKILGELAECIKSMLIEKKILAEDSFEVTSAGGAGFYPKNPWIGVFINGETATNGVYPVLGFYNDSAGCFIGCAESFTNPQFGFSSEYCSDANRTEDDRDVLKRTGLDKDPHIARMPSIFEAGQHIEDEAMINALRQAISIRTEYRKKYPLFQLSVMSEDSNDNKLAESATSTWYKEIVVDDIDKWTYFVTHPHKMSKEPIQWIFRGQGDARWHLESSLFRQVGGSRDFDSIVKIETNSMNFFRRETYDSSLCQSLKGVNLLAVMQHYGSATRLLDFTYAPLTALFFAIDQRAQLLSNTNSYFAHHVKQSLHDNSNLDIGNPDDNVWVAVWAFNLRAILGNLLTDNNSDLNLALIKSTEEANKIIENSIGHSGDKGIDVVLPMTGNERLSAQSGLFLMAKDMGKPFEENLRATLPFPLKITLEDCERVKISSITDWNDIVRKFSVVKFVFRSAVIEDLDMMLRSLHMTYKTVYPDLSGIAKDATANLG